METLAKVAGKPGNSGKCPENSRTACREEPGNPGNPLYKRGSLPASRIPLLGVKKESFSLSRPLQIECERKSV